MTQLQRVIKYIENYGSITPFDAFKDLGITKLATVLSMARLQCGMIVYSCIEKSLNRFGDHTCYKRYFLDKEEYKEYLTLGPLYILDKRIK